MIPRCTVGKGVTGAVRYILGEGRDRETGKPRPKPGHGKSRVTSFGGIGFGFDIASHDDADLARRMMEFDAQNQKSRTKRCEKDCLHLSLGWRPGETPSLDDMRAAARNALQAIGMENARALFAIHNDEGYAHIHIVASKINPETGRAYDLKENYLKLSKWAEQYERDFSGGVICAKREESNELRDAVTKRDVGGVLDVMTKQRATFTAADLDRTLKKQIKNTPERTAFAQRILSHTSVVELSDEADGPTSRYTTKAVLEAEGHVLRAAQGLARAQRHQVSDVVRREALRRDAFRSMTAEQLAVFHHATGKDGLALIDGRAGTGKSFTMSAIRSAYEASGYRVVGLAPTNAVAQDMQRDGFRGASTIHSQLFALNNRRDAWNRRTVVMVDEAAMIDTRLMAMLTAHAFASGVKLILIGDDRQLSSIDRGGMFSALKERYGAASLTSVRRQTKDDDRRATELMAEGNFHDALAQYDSKGAIRWTETQEAARAALVRRWAADTATDPSRSRFVFAYTNVDVYALNRDLRRVREARGELGLGHSFETAHGRHDFSIGDRLQFTGTDKRQGIFNGNAGIIEKLSAQSITVRLDGDEGRRITFDPETFVDFRHGYAGTIYKGQGRTIDQTYLYHTEHWRSAASYVALSRHREKVQLFVARDTARDLNQLARQMARLEERRAASQFFHAGEQAGPVRPLTPWELLVRLGEQSLSRKLQRDQIRRRFRRATSDIVEDHRTPMDSDRTVEARQKGSAGQASGKSDTHKTAGQSPSPDQEVQAIPSTTKSSLLRNLWRQVVGFLTMLCPTAPIATGSRSANRKRGPRP
jgi:Ti-type conjugative transfer relaxase TraA